MKIILSLALLTTLLPVWAGTPTTYFSTWTGAQLIPDNNASGIAFPFSIATPAGSSIASVTVDLKLAGGWNGDLYAYLSHGNGFSVLLNRVGRTALHSEGFGAAGFDVSLADANPTDIHSADGSAVNGRFAPDGRSVSPFVVLDTTPRNALFSSFTGSDPGGAWTLFFADVAPAATATIQSWKVSVAVVPEPSGGVLLGLAIILMARKCRPGRSAAHA